MEQDDDDCFVDAHEDVTTTHQCMAKDDEVNLNYGIDEARVALNLFLNNHFEEAKQRMKPLARKSVYHATAYSTALFIKAIMTCEHEDIESACKASKEAISVSDRIRKQRSGSPFMPKLPQQVRKIVVQTLNGGQGGGDPRADLTNEQIHAELCYAECLLQQALITFIQDENLIAFVNGAWKIRTCYKSYRECQRILTAVNWKERDEKVRCEFESGVRWGIGTFNMMISALPARILNLLEFVGFQGNRELGLHELRMGALSEGTLRAPVCAMALLCWHLIGVYLFGTGQADLKLCTQLVNTLLDKYPKGALVLYFAGRYCAVTAKISRAVAYFNDSMEAESDWKQYRHLCCWELMFCHAFKREWSTAAGYGQQLLEENRWSPCLYSYLTAVFLSADWHRLDHANKLLVQQLFEAVPLRKQRIAGKSLPPEKFCCAKARRFGKKRRLPLAHYEIVYLYNGFRLFAKDSTMVVPILDDVQEELDSGSLDADDRSLCLLLKATCLRYLQSPFQAEQCLADIFLIEQRLKDNYYTVPNGYFDLAVIRLDEGDIPAAKEALAKARTYKGYLLETRLHFRMHSLSERLYGKNYRTPVSP